MTTIVAFCFVKYVRHPLLVSPGLVTSDTLARLSRLRIPAKEEDAGKNTEESVSATEGAGACAAPGDGSEGMCGAVGAGDKAPSADAAGATLRAVQGSGTSA